MQKIGSLKVLAYHTVFVEPVERAKSNVERCIRRIAVSRNPVAAISSYERALERLAACERTRDCADKFGLNQGVSE